MMTLRSLKYSLCVGLLLNLAACDSGGESAVADYSNCRYEKPEAIFYDGLPQIRDYHFTSRGRGSEETFVLSDAIGISIVQYGCDFRTQEFIFDLERREACRNAEECCLQVVQLLQTLSRLGPEYHVFRAWAQAIKDVAEEIELEESIQIAEGFWVKIDQRNNFGNTTLMLTLSEKP